MVLVIIFNILFIGCFMWLWIDYSIEKDYWPTTENKVVKYKFRDYLKFRKIFPNKFERVYYLDKPKIVYHKTENNYEKYIDYSLNMGFIGYLYLIFSEIYLKIRKQTPDDIKRAKIQRSIEIAILEDMQLTVEKQLQQSQQQMQKAIDEAKKITQRISQGAH